jgi:hypothetical protein
LDHIEPAVYGLNRPGLTEAHAALAEVFGAQRAGVLWRELTGAAGLEGTETGPGALPALLAVMARGGDVLALCAASLTIRLATFEKLSQVSTIVRSAS